MATELPPLRHVPQGRAAGHGAQAVGGTTYDVWLKQKGLGMDVGERVIAAVASVAAATAGVEAADGVDWRHRGMGLLHAAGAYKAELEQLEREQRHAEKLRTMPPRRPSASWRPPLSVFTAKAPPLKPQAPPGGLPALPPAQSRLPPGPTGGWGHRRPPSPFDKTWGSMQEAARTEQYTSTMAEKSFDPLERSRCTIDHRNVSVVTEPTVAPEDEHGEAERQREAEQAAAAFAANRRAVAEAAEESRRELLQLQQEQSQREAEVRADHFKLWPTTHRPDTRQRRQMQPPLKYLWPPLTPPPSPPPVCEYKPVMMAAALARNDHYGCRFSGALVSLLRLRASAAIQRAIRKFVRMRRALRQQRHLRATLRMQQHGRGLRGRRALWTHRAGLAAPTIQRAARCRQARVRAEALREQRDAWGLFDALGKVPSWRLARGEAQRHGMLDADLVSDAIWNLSVCFPVQYSEALGDPAPLAFALSGDLADARGGAEAESDAAYDLLVRKAAGAVVPALLRSFAALDADCGPLEVCLHKLLAEAQEEEFAARELQRGLRGGLDRCRLAVKSREQGWRTQLLRSAAALTPPGSYVRSLLCARGGRPPEQAAPPHRCPALWTLALCSRWGGKVWQLAAVARRPGHAEVLRATVQIQRVVRGRQARRGVGLLREATAAARLQRDLPMRYRARCGTALEARDMVALLRAWYCDKRGDLADELLSNMPLAETPRGGPTRRQRIAVAARELCSSPLAACTFGDTLSPLEMLVAHMAATATDSAGEADPGWAPSAARRAVGRAFDAAEDAVPHRARQVLRRWVKWMATLLACCCSDAAARHPDSGELYRGVGEVAVDAVDAVRRLRPGSTMAWPAPAFVHTTRRAADKHLRSTPELPGTCLFRIRRPTAALPLRLFARHPAAEFMQGPCECFRVDQVGQDARNPRGEGVMVILTHLGPLGYPISHQQGLLNFLARVRRDAAAATQKLFAELPLPLPRPPRLRPTALSVVAEATAAGSALRGIAAACGIPVPPPSGPMVSPRAPQEEPQSPATARPPASPPAFEYGHMLAAITQLGSCARLLFGTADNDRDWTPSEILAAAIASPLPSTSTSVTPNLLSELLRFDEDQNEASVGSMGALEEVASFEHDPDAKRSQSATKLLELERAREREGTNMLPLLLEAGRELGLRCVALSAAQRCGIADGDSDALASMLPFILDAHSGAAESEVVAVVTSALESPRSCASADRRPLSRSSARNLLPLLLRAGEEAAADCFALAFVAADAVAAAGMPPPSRSTTPATRPGTAPSAPGEWAVPQPSALGMLVEVGAAVGKSMPAVRTLLKLARPEVALPASRSRLASTAAGSRPASRALSASNAPLALGVLLEVGGELGKDLPAVRHLVGLLQRPPSRPDSRQRCLQQLPELAEAAAGIGVGCFTVAWSAEREEVAASATGGGGGPQQHEALPLLAAAARRMGCGCFAVAWMSAAGSGVPAEPLLHEAGTRMGEDAHRECAVAVASSSGIEARLVAVAELASAVAAAHAAGAAGCAIAWPCETAVPAATPPEPASAPAAPLSESPVRGWGLEMLAKAGARDDFPQLEMLMQAHAEGPLPADRN